MRKQKGFTLLELLVALAIISAITLVSLDILFNIQIGANRNVNQLMINDDLSISIRAIRQDLMITQSYNITANETTLRWIDYTGNQTDHTVIYSFSGINGTAPTVLWREYDGNPTIVGRRITNLIFTPGNGSISVNITSSANQTPARSKTVEFSILMRQEVEQ